VPRDAPGTAGNQGDVNSLLDRVTDLAFVPTTEPVRRPRSSASPSAHPTNFRSPSPRSHEEPRSHPARRRRPLVRRGVRAGSAPGGRSSGRDGRRRTVPLRRPHSPRRHGGAQRDAAKLGLPTMFPTIGGHEGSGTVREVGDGVTEFAPGDHVVMSFVAVCGQCAGVRAVWSTSATWGQRHDARHADRRHLPPSHRRRQTAGPHSQSGSIRQTHCGVDEFPRQDRAAPAVGAQRAAVLRDSDRVWIGREPLRHAGGRHRRGGRRRRNRNGRDPGRPGRRRRTDPCRRSGGVQTEVGPAVRRHSHGGDGARGAGAGARADLRRDGRRGGGVAIADQTRRCPRCAETHPQGRHLWCSPA